MLKKSLFMMIAFGLVCMNGQSLTLRPVGAATSDEYEAIPPF